MIKRHKLTFMLWTLVVVLCSSVGVYTWLHSKAKVAPPQTAIVTKATLTQIISASGQITASGQVQITTQATGKVSKLYIHVGQTVKKGDKILEIEPDLATLQAQQSAWSNYLQAKNGLNQANAQLYVLAAAKAGAEQKFNDDAVANNKASTDPMYIQEKNALLAAEADYDNQSGVILQAKAEVDSAYATYSKTSSTVTAPADGVIQDISYEEGTYIAAATSSSTSNATSSSLATLKIANKLTTALNVSELDIAGIQNGQDVALTLTALAGKTYHGKVISVGATGTTDSGITTYPVNVEITDGVAGMLTGMAVSGDITTQIKKDVLSLPNATIKASGQNYTAIRLKNGQQQTVTITVGLVLDTQTEITSGLSEGDEVVVPTASSTSSSSSDSVTGTSSQGPASSDRK
jgi:macrolide-specific efflux system membrane fusion protein